MLIVEDMCAWMWSSWEIFHPVDDVRGWSLKVVGVGSGGEVAYSL